MLFEKDEDLELQPKRTKTLIISIGIHLALIVFLIFNPDLLTSPPKRIIKVMGEDYDLSKENLTELVVPPDALRPKPAVPDKPLVQPPAPQPKPEEQQPQQQPQPQPQPQQAPPPPPPPPPPKPQTPPPVIRPDDVIKDGARPDGQAKASRGDTTEQARAGGGGQQPQQQSQPIPKPEPGKSQQPQAEKELPQIARNTNPNALPLPEGNIMDSARRTVQQQLDEERKRSSSLQGPRTGLPAGQEEPNFSTEEPTILSDTRGYDFGPYMNQVVNRVRSNWYSLIPESARLGKRGKVVLTFTITKDGKIANLLLRANSGTDALDRAAIGGIQLSNPFTQLPANFDGDHLDLQFTFMYNIR